MVIRYVISFMNKDGMRQIAYQCQGRNTSATKIEAETELEAFLKNNNPQTLQSIFGKDCLGTFEVSAIECYDGHFDPVGCWISEKLNPGQVCLTGPISQRTMRLFRMQPGRRKRGSMTEAQVLQWKELGVPGVESLIAKGYQFCVQYSEGGKPYGEPLCFKTVDDISSFMRTYPNMKIIWQRKLTDHPEILTDRPHTRLPNYDSWGEDA